MTTSKRWWRRGPLYAGSIASGLWLLSAPGLAEAQEPETEPAATEAAEPDADAAALAAEEAEASATLQKPPPKGKGVVWGGVTDTKFHEGVIDAQVQVVGRKEKVLTNVDGHYRLELAPGKYRLRVSYELHRPARIDDVVVHEGELIHLDVQLVPDESAVEEVVIEDEVDHASTEGQALTRKSSSVVGDGVGRAEIARTPDKNAAEAAQRVVGATIVGGRFVFVRGLGERYTNALLNGAPLPSPEPDRNTVPLDLFPSLVLDNLTIVKQFTPDMPGDFAGGSVRITTRDFPKQRLLQLTLTGGYNSEATFRKRTTDYGSSGDWLGFDSGRRGLPGEVPERKVGSSSDPEERARLGQRMNTPMATLRKLTPPNHGLTFVAGDSLKLAGNSKLGSLLALTYSHGYELSDVQLRRFRGNDSSQGDPDLVVADDFRGPIATDTVRWGAFGNVALESSRYQTLSLMALHSQSASDSAAELEGTFENQPATRVHAQHLEYVSRSLNFVQLRGEHRFPKQRELEIAWHASVALADRDQPDTRDLRYRQITRAGVLGWEFSPDQSGQHQFLKQHDRTLTFGLDVTQPLIQSKEHATKLKAGTLVSSRARNFQARRFQYEPDTTQSQNYQDAKFCPGATFKSSCPGFLFRPELVGPGALLLDEWTLDLDRYETGLDVYGAYGMLDSLLTPELRAVAGVRAEITYQLFAGFKPFDTSAPPTQSNIFQTDWLPAVSLVYALSPKTNARLGLSKTVARPQLRELSPVLFTSAAGDLNLQGNPNLKITQIVNADLRLEYFPTLREVLAASIFYKHFDHPIEDIMATNGTRGFTNADSAELWGLELEARQGLEALSARLKPLTAIANLTLVSSQVKLGEHAGAMAATNRPLTNQSPYVVNLQLDYENTTAATDFRVLYNVYGPRIAIAGALGLPDIYELPRHQLDAAVSKKLGKHFDLKLQAQNLLLSPVVFAFRNHPGYTAQANAAGTTYTSLGKNPETRHYQPGMTVSLSASYTY